MKEIIALNIVFGLLYIIEKKSINKLANYIGIVLTIAIILGLNYCEFLSFLLILVQISGLTILFGFIIMLIGNNNFSIKNFGGTAINYNDKKDTYFYIISIGFIIIILLLVLLLLALQSQFFSLKTLFLYIIQFIDKSNSLFKIIIGTSPGDVNDNFLFTLSDILYINNNHFIKFILLTLILFFSLIAFFFLLPSKKVSHRSQDT